MDLDLFRKDMQKIHLDNRIRQRIIQASASGLQDRPDNTQPISIWSRRLLHPAVLASLMIVILAGSLIFLAGPAIVDRYRLSGCPPSFADRYFALIEWDDAAYVFQGNGMLHQLTESGDLQKIKQLPATDLLSDGEVFFYAKGARVYRFKPDERGKTMIFKEKTALSLDYVHPDWLVYHFGNHDHYILFDRNLSVKHQLFTIDQDKNYSFLTASDRHAIFAHSEDGSDSLAVVDLETRQISKMIEGSIQNRVVIIGDQVYLTRAGETADHSRDLATELWTVNLDGSDLRRIDLSGILFEDIQSIAASGRDLLIATDEDVAQHKGKIYLFRPESGIFSILQNQIGLIDRLFATDHFYSYYDLGTGDTAGKAWVGRIERAD